MWWEDLWPRLWPPLSLAAVFFGLAFADLLPGLHPALHLAILAGFALAFAATVVRGLRGLRWPSRAATRRRLERESDLEHRPITTLEDSLAGDEDPAAAALWQRHQFRAAAAAARAQAGPPRPDVGRRDPWALRVAAALALVAGFFVAGPDATTRVARAVTPNLASLTAATPATFDIWITPPAYTGLAPTFIESGAALPADLRIAADSTLLAQVHNGRGDPALTIAGETLNFDPVDAANWRLEHTVAAPAEVTTDLVIAQRDDPLLTLPVTLIPDAPPIITFAEPPAATARAALQVIYAASDDYGITAVQGTVKRAAGPDGQPAPIAEPLVLDLPSPPPATPEVPVEPVLSFHDLTAHPWAGLPVELTLSATDGRGQTGTSETVAFVLPEREFNHPVARQIVAERKRLVQTPDDRAPTIDALTGITRQPERYANDFAVHLGLNAARSRLAVNDDATVVDEVLQLLWDLALRIEDGGLSLAERELRQLQEQLQQALEDGASDQEIEALLEELQAALDRFFEAARQNLRERLENGEISPQAADPNALTLSQEDLDRLIDQARDLNRLGAREAARQMLSQLQQMLENLNSEPMLAQPNPQQEQAEQMLGDLQRIIRGQQRLLDETFRQSREGQQPGDQELGAAAQELLRRELGEAMRQLGEALGDIPAPLGNAEQSMRGSTEALTEGDPGGAIGPQGDALDQLREGARTAAQQLAEQLGPGPGGQQPGQFGQGSQQQGTDPFGRPLDGNQADTSDVLIPDEAELQRARQILDELRRRSGERFRPQLEREYIERLLRRF